MEVVIIIGIVLTGLLLFLRYLFNDRLPSNINQIIKEVQQEPLPELMPGERGTAYNGKVGIAFEFIHPENAKNGTVLLIMGHTRSLLDWPLEFINPLLEAGYHVVRFDNRGVGLSDWIPNWSKENDYRLKDMAEDGLAVLDQLNIASAHVIGVSMGGMIGQEMAIHFPERVNSLCSIMSTGFYYDPDLVDVPKPFARSLTLLNLKYRRTLSQEESKMKYLLGIEYILKGKGDYDLDDKKLLQKTLYELRNRRGFNGRAADQQSRAIVKSPSRYEGLKKLEIPVLVIHGTDDTLVLFEHAQKYAPMIPDVKTLFIEGMGHDLPEIHIPSMIKSILENFERKPKQVTTT